MKILFIQPPLDDGNVRMPLSQRLFPWGFATVARMLEDDGHEIQVLDVYARDLVREEVIEYLDHMRFEAACITGFSSINYLYVLWLAGEIKKRYSVPMIVGGLLADNHYDLLLSKGTIDVCVLGEGELTAVEVFRNLDKLSAVQGIAYQINGRTEVNEMRKDIPDLDMLPLPNFDLWDMERYTKAKMYAQDESTMFEMYADYPEVASEHLLPNMSFQAGRGCPYKCKFCARSYDYLRLKSITRIIDEIKCLKNLYKLKAVHFMDETLILNKARTLEFAKEIKKLDLYWDGQARVNCVDEEILKVLKDSNCLSVGLGLESGSNKMLKAMNKGITRDMSLRVLKAARKVGIHLKIQLMAGYPGETKKTLAETVSLIRRAGLPPRRLTWCTPLPGSELYKNAMREGLIKDEEEYIIKLHKGYNHPGNIVLNVSALSDSEMIKILKWAHMRMDFDYALTLFKKPDRVLDKMVFRFLKGVVIKIMDYYAPSLLRGLVELKHFLVGSSVKTIDRKKLSSGVS